MFGTDQVISAFILCAVAALFLSPSRPTPESPVHSEHTDMAFFSHSTGVSLLLLNFPWAMLIEWFPSLVGLRGLSSRRLGVGGERGDREGGVRQLSQLETEFDLRCYCRRVTFDPLFPASARCG